MGINVAQLMTVEYLLAVMGLLLGYKCVYLKKNNMNFFMRFVVALILFLLVNIPVRMVELELVEWNCELVFWIYALSVVLMTFTSMYWFVFALRQINSKLIDNTYKIRLSSLPAIAIIPICIINRWTGWLYYIDEASHYHRGSIFVLQALISYLYYLFIIISIIYHIIKDREKVAAVKCLFALSPSIICVFLQIVFGGSYLLAGITIGAWVMYIEVCLDRQKAYEMSDAISEINDALNHSNKEIANNMKTILALSDIYNIMYSVDLINDTFKEIKAPKEVSEFCSQFTSAKECLGKLPRAMFLEDDISAMESLYNYFTIQDRLKNTNSCFADGKGIGNKEWLRTSIIVSERDDEGNAITVVFAIQNVNDLIKQQKMMEEAQLLQEHADEMKELFVQTAEALAGAIDAKDGYTHGHSLRVAKYSKKIAQMAGLSEEECEKVYFAGMLHDVGKIGIDNSIINKEGKLTEEEYNQIKQHPVYGMQILTKIDRLPYLRVGAHHHHERFDGRGYPDGLKGSDIPVLARIIAVADAYDAMTSKRSYRDIIPQQQVREQMVIGSGTQFDPEFAKHMITLIDQDFEYSMREKIDAANVDIQSEFRFEDYLSDFTEGWWIISIPLTIKLHFKTRDKNKSLYSMPSLIIYDSFDSKIHVKENQIKEMHYTENITIRADGKVTEGVIRKYKETRSPVIMINPKAFATSCNEGMDVVYELAKFKDHLRIRMKNKYQEFEYIVALEDSIRYSYAAITGENCDVEIESIEKDTETIINRDEIPRIAEEVSYAIGPEGDIPNFEVAAWRVNNSQAIEVTGKHEIRFHSMSLPTARLIWHCPFVVLYSSDDKKINGVNYREYALVRLDGESWSEDSDVNNDRVVNMTTAFKNWKNWKEQNKAGVDCCVTLERNDNTISIRTSDAGIELYDTIILPEDIDKVYMVLTGDQVAMTDIHIINS